MKVEGDCLMMNSLEVGMRGLFMNNFRNNRLLMNTRMKLRIIGRAQE